MGLLYETYKATKKTCKYCGCIMDARHEGDVCECCLDDLYESDPGEDEESLYPTLCIDNLPREKVVEIVNDRVGGKL